MFALVNNVWIRVENSSPHLGLLKCWEVFQNHLLNPILFIAIDFMVHFWMPWLLPKMVFSPWRREVCDSQSLCQWDTNYSQLELPVGGSVLAGTGVLVLITCVPGIAFSTCVWGGVRWSHMGVVAQSRRKKSQSESVLLRPGYGRWGFLEVVAWETLRESQWRRNEDLYIEAWA